MKSSATKEKTGLFYMFLLSGIPNLPRLNHQKMSESLKHNFYSKLSVKAAVGEEDEDICTAYSRSSLQWNTFWSHW